MADDGVFVLGCRIPSASARPGHQHVDAEHIAAGHIMLDVGRYDPVTQILDLNHVRISAGGLTLNPISLRLAHPPEFDLMGPHRRAPAAGAMGRLERRALDGYRPEEVGSALNSEGIAVRAGHHCAQPILRRFGLAATVRAALAMYNTHAEVDLLAAALHRLSRRRTR